MTPELKYKVRRCGELLAQSPLDDEIKNTVIENIGKMTENQLDQIIHSLERETIELTALAKLLKNFDKKQDESWKSLEEKQKELAGRVIEETLQKAG